MKFGNCSFSFAGPTAWNSLPDHVKNAPSLETCKSKLKTHLFKSQLATKSLNSCTAPFLSVSAVLRRYRNRLIITQSRVANTCQLNATMCFDVSNLEWPHEK